MATAPIRATEDEGRAWTKDQISSRLEGDRFLQLKFTSFLQKATQN